MKDKKGIPKIEEARRRIKKVKEKHFNELDLCGLNLTKIPHEVFGLRHLEILLLSQNQLTELPKEISELEDLLGLYLSRNHLTHFPKEIAQLKNLEMLRLEGNKNLISPPPSVIKQGTKAILNYLKALDKKTTVWTSKMVLVGEGGVGKTCLLDALQDKDFEPGKDTT
jgi:internalin A